VKGVDPEIYNAFRSHCLQNYLQYQIVFGVSEANDPAIEVVRRMEKEFPDPEIQLVICERELGTNVKVSNRVQMLRVARYDFLIVNDSDIGSSRIICAAVVETFLPSYTLRAYFEHQLRWARSGS
jgi:ceramide glucosyltransferase